MCARSGNELPLTAALLATTLLFAPAYADEPPLRDVIDAQIRAAWEREGITPAGQADDATFLRRVHLDLVGTIPTYQEAGAFLEDKDPRKRQQLIDRLLNDPRFAGHQANHWDLVLFGRNSSELLKSEHRERFRKWLTEQFAKNVPYDRWARELLLAEQEGAEIFYVPYNNRPEDATVAVSRIFLGTQVQCARCHDHPHAEWTQRDFYGMAGFFVRLAVIDGGAKGFFIGERNGGEVLFTGSAKDQKPGQKGEPVKPRFLGGPELAEPTPPMKVTEAKLPARSSERPPKPFFSRKQRLAEWVTAADNPYFAKAVANRLWGQFMGRGLVHPVDDLNSRSSPSHPELFPVLAREMVAHRFDLKWYVRELVNSATYQQAATGSNTATLPRRYERARVRPLAAEELMAALAVATGSDQKLDARYFLQYFGEPSDGQGEFQGGLSEHLFLNNNRDIWKLMLRGKGNLADALLSSTAPWEERVDRLFLSVLSRLPQPDERQRFVAHLTADQQTEARVSEAIWALVNGAEFRFNH